MLDPFQRPDDRRRTRRDSIRTGNDRHVLCPGRPVLGRFGLHGGSLPRMRPMLFVQKRPLHALDMNLSAMRQRIALPFFLNGERINVSLECFITFTRATWRGDPARGEALFPNLYPFSKNAFEGALPLRIRFLRHPRRVLRGGDVPF